MLETQGLKVFRVYKVFRDLKEIRGMLETKVSRVFKVLLVSMLYGITLASTIMELHTLSET
jgi:hypothetical protein